MDMNLSKLRESVMDREAWRAAIHGVTKSRTRLRDWTTYSNQNISSITLEAQHFKNSCVFLMLLFCSLCLHFCVSVTYYRASLVAQMVKNPPAVWDTWVPSLGWEDPLEKGMATHSSILAWRISISEDPGVLQSMGLQRVGLDWATTKLCQNF